MAELAEVYRLPTDSKPTHYDVTVRTDLAGAKFDGIVVVQCVAKQEHGVHTVADLHNSLNQIRESSKIVFNTAGLELFNITLSVQEKGDAKFTPASIDFDEKLERCMLGLPQTTPAGVHLRLEIAFEGELTDDLMGYYKSLNGQDGQDVCALTQFEVRPSLLRNAFQARHQ